MGSLVHSWDVYQPPSLSQTFMMQFSSGICFSAAGLLLLCLPSEAAGLKAAAGDHKSLSASGAFLNHLPSSHGAHHELSLHDARPGLLMATLAGLSTTLGALVLFCMPSGGPPPKAMAYALSLAAGVMVTVSAEMCCPSFLGHADEHGSDHGHNHGHDGHDHQHDDAHPVAWWWPLLLFFLGSLLTFIFCKAGDLLYGLAAPGDGLPAQHAASDMVDPSSGPRSIPGNVALGEPLEKEEIRLRYKWRLAVLMFMSLTAHNFPEGFAVAISALSSKQLGILICVAIACHNIPEGIAIAVTTYDATKSRFQSIMMTFLSGLSEPFGAFCAVLLLQSVLTPTLLNDLLTIVAGVMFYIAVAELIPAAFGTGQWLWMLAGFVSGVLVMVGTHMGIEYAMENGHV